MDGEIAAFGVGPDDMSPGKILEDYTKNVTREYNFNTPLDNVHPCEVEDTQLPLDLVDDIFTMPLVYIGGAVMFPKASLALKARHPHSKSALYAAVSEDPYTIGVVRVYTDVDNRTRFATIGTTAKILVFSKLRNGSWEVLAGVQQRFRLRHCWITDGRPYGEVQIIKEDLPLRTPNSISVRRKGEGRMEGLPITALNHSRKVSVAFLPEWAYRTNDSYCLAQRAADLWTKLTVKAVGEKNMEVLVKNPGDLSFFIAGKIPVSDSVRQELLGINGITYRLHREIELLESFDVRCKECKTVIARRSHMLKMCSDGLVGAYANPHGYVHQVVTLYEARGMGLVGYPVKEYSWYPGYAWRAAYCVCCKTSMGWFFKATDTKLEPESFWAIRTSQVLEMTWLELET